MDDLHQFSVRRAETFSVRKKMAAIKFENFFVDREGLVELLRPSALRTRLMHFPFEIIICILES
jgi:hypothetical protein